MNIHKGTELPVSNGMKLVLIRLGAIGRYWKIVEFSGGWILEGHPYENLDDDEIEVLGWTELPSIEVVQ